MQKPPTLSIVDDAVCTCHFDFTTLLRIKLLDSSQSRTNGHKSVSLLGNNHKPNHPMGTLYVLVLPGDLINPLWFI